MEAAALKIDLSCPAELRKYELPRENYPACDLMLYNLARKTITSVEVTLSLILQDEKLDRVVYRAHDLDGRSGTVFAVTVPAGEKTAADRVEVVIDKVWFDDNSIWRRSKTPMTEYVPNDLPAGKALEFLHFFAGKDAVGYPEEREDLWMCLCGRPNPLGEPVCIRCHRTRQELFSRFTREKVEQEAKQHEQRMRLITKSALEYTSQIQLQREQEYLAKQKKKKKIIAIACGVAAAALLAYGTVFHVVPLMKYQNACKLMEAGLYPSAEKAFLAMTDYRDAADKATDCRYLQAKTLLAENKDESLTQAKALFTELGEYEDSADLALEADYLLAGRLLAAGKPEGAEDLYMSLGDYKDSAQQVKECRFQRAEALLEKGSYEEAKALYQVLGDYGTSAERLPLCDYRPALQLLEDGKYDEAMAAFTALGDYQDCPALLKQAAYGKAAAQEAEGQLAEAAETYLLAADYEDAAAKASECFYQAAETAFNAGNDDLAALLYGRILDYKDSADKYTATAYHSAARAINDKEYQRAAALLAALPEGTPDPDNLKQEVIYQPALGALEAGRYQEAVDGFLQLDRYKDSRAKLRQARYGLAQQLAEQGEYQQAIDLFTLLADYKDSKSLAKAARYQWAQALQDAGSYEEAISLYTQLRNYKESPDRLKQCKYLQAGVLMEQKDYAGARELYKSLGRYEDARTKVKEADYRTAQALEEENKPIEAARLYESLGDYEDAAEKAGSIWYTLADQAEKAGDWAAAAVSFLHAGSYSDAAQRAAAVYDAAYGETAAQVTEAMEKEDYAAVVDLLKDVAVNDLPESYAFLKDRWLEANYRQAEALYKGGMVYEALPFYQAIPGYRDVDKTLEKACYQLLGTWQDEAGDRYEFRPDYTCSLNGEELYFRPATWSIETGTDPEQLEKNMRISRIGKTNATLRDNRTAENRTLNLTRMTGTGE